MNILLLAGDLEKYHDYFNDISIAHMEELKLFQVPYGLNLVFHVFGHTRLDKERMENSEYDNLAMIDSRQCFMVDESKKEKILPLIKKIRKNWKMKRDLSYIVLLCVIMGFCGCGQRQKVVADRQELDTAIRDTVSDGEADSFSIGNDSFTVVYRQPVKGYKVTAILKPSNYDCFVSSADITFTKEGKSFTLHTECFGDTMFCKGRYDSDQLNSNIFRQYRNKTVNADYHVTIDNNRPMPYNTPFFFKDMDFDGKEELVIVHNSLGVRFHDGYDIYRIVEGKPFRIDYPPYNDNVKDWGFGMTDYPEFDYKAKTISCPYPEGEMTYGSRIIYGVSKKHMDTVVVNGQTHYYNHIEKIKEMEY